MPTLQEILQDQNYINANPATKKAIFDRWSALDTNYTGANQATQQAIRSRFGVGGIEEAPPAEPPKDKGFFSNVGNLLVEGGKRAIGSAQVSPSVIAGDVSEDKAKLLSEQLSMKPSVQPKELVEAQTAFKDEAEAFEKAKGFTESIGPFAGFLLEFGKQVITNPKGAVYLTAQSAANMAPQIAGMIAGGKGGALAGSLAGPGGAAVGAAAGAVGGGFAAGVPLEIGSEFIGRIGEKLAERGLEPTEENIAALLRDKAVVEQAISEARTKGVTTAAVDSLMTVGAGKFASGPRRAAIEAARKEMGATADAAKLAARADEILKARTMTQKVGRGAGAVGIETAGGGISEAAGQAAAYGKVNLEDVGAEMLGELGGSAASVPAAAYSTTQDMLKSKAKTDAAKILADEEQARVAAEEQAKTPAPEMGAVSAPSPAPLQEPSPEPYVKPPSISGTKPDVLLGGREDPLSEREDPLAGVVSKRRAEAEPTGEIPLGDDYAFLQREKQRLLQEDQTPETKKLLGRINDQLGVVLKRDIERLRNESETLKRNREADAEATKTSVFGQEELPPVESRDVVVGNMELGELQAQEAPPVDPLTGRELKSFGRMVGEPQPMIPEVEAEVEKLTKDQELAVAEREKLEKRTSGTSLSQVLRGTLRDAELSELGGRARQVGKNPFLNLKAPKGQTGSSMEDMVDTGKLDIFLPVKMRPDSPDYVNSESAEYIREKLRNNQLYTYETELAIQRVDNDIESIERQIQELLSDDEINKELQYAANEQRELDQDAQEPAAPEADRTPEQREAEKTDADLDKRQAQLDREAELNQREARLLEERKRLEEERLKLESPTKDEVKQQEERKEKAPELDEREQIRKESEAGAGQFELTREEGRQDTTGDIFSQPEPTPEAEPEPKVVAISPEQERKEAMENFALKLRFPILPFRAVSARKTQLLKPADLTSAQVKELVGLASDALDLGLPPLVLGNVTAAGSTRMDVTAVMSSGGSLMIAKKWKDSSRAEKLQTLIHELAHAVDTAGGKVSNAASWSKAHAELQGWYSGSANKLQHPLAYPFAPQFKGRVRPKEESFAQAFAYYFVSPVDLQTNAPEAYSQIQSIVERIQDGSQEARATGTTKTGTAGIKIQPARAVESAAVQPAVGAERADVSGAARLADRGAGEVTKAPPTDSAAFKKWFGDSKVVDENGEPLVVYHGTASDFSEFAEEKLGINTRETDGELGFFFTAKPFLSDSYAEIASKGGWGKRTQGGSPVVYPVYLSLKNPKKYGSASSFYRDAENFKGRFNEWRTELEEQGFDGVVVRDDFEEVIAFRPTQIKSATGNIGTYDPEVQDINMMQRDSITGKPILAQWTTPTDTKIAGDINKDDIIYSLQNKMIDTKRVVDAITATAGKIAAKWNPYLQEELYHGRTAKQTKDFLTEELRPLMQAMEKAGVNIADMEEYLKNRHAIAYNEQVAKVNPKMPDKGSGIATADAQAYLNSLSPADKAKYEALAKRVDQITKGTRKLLVDSGLETQETIDNWEKTFPFYVPLKRGDIDYAYTAGGMGTGQGFDVRGDFSRRAMGSERDATDVLANIAMMRERAIVKSQKNRVAQALFGLAAQNPNPQFWLPVDPMAEVDPANMQELLNFGLSQQDLDFIAKEPRQKAIDKNRNEVVERINATLRGNENVLSMRFNGQDRYVFFNPNDPRSERMAKSMKNLDADQLGNILGPLSTVTRWMAAVNTQYNPIFGAYNFLRDVQGAALQLSDTPLAKERKAVVGGTLPALKGIYAAVRAERNGTQATGPWAALWEEFQQEGGQTGFRDQFSRSQERAEALQKELNKITEGKVKTAGRAVVDWLSDYNDSMENAVRLSAYKAALDKGIDKQEAASIAKNLTVNFNRKGQIGVQAGALYAFFNAAVQGTTRLAQTLKGPAGKKIIAGGLLLGTMQAALLAAAGFDEEEPPEFIRERNLIIPIGGDKYIAFPMPLGYHVIPGTSRILTEWALSGFKDTPERVASLTGMFLEAFNPIGNAGWSAQTLAPTFADPIVALTENKDWTGKPIARKDFSNLDPTPGYTRSKEATNIVFKKIAEYLNLASGGTDFKPGVFSPTPDQLEYLWGQATGGLGREIAKGITTVEKTITGEDLPSYKIPLAGRFYGETKSSAAESGRFYKNMEKLNKHENEIKGRRESKQPLGDYLKDNPEARLAPMARKVYNDVRDLRKRREALIERDAPKESVQAVEKMITRKMQVLNDRVRALEESSN